MIQPEEVPGHLEDLKPYVSLVCEAQVLDFNARAGYGPWIKFRFQNPETLAGFATGQRFHLLLIAIGDDDMPATANPQDRKPYKLSQISGMLCSQDDFRQWVTQTYGEVCHNKDEAADWVRKACNVESRSLLDVDETAATTFRAIMAAFDAWKQKGAAGGTE